MTIEDTLLKIERDLIDVKKMLVIAFPDKYKFKLKCPRCGCSEIKELDRNYFVCTYYQCHYNGLKLNFKLELEL